MTEPLQVGQFAIVDHEPVDRGPNAGVFHGRGPADDRAELYIVAEGTTPAGEAFAGHVVSAIGHTWASLDLSLTGALRRVFAEAQRNLHDWNQKSIAQHRVSLGLTCLGRRGDQAVIAQAGPSVVFHLHEGQVRAYFSDEEHGRPIGMGPGAEPQLTRVPFAPGDRLLLFSTAALRALDDDLIAGIIALPADQVLPDLYRRLRDLRHLTALLVTTPEKPVTPARGLPATAEAAPGEFVIGVTDPAATPPSLPPGPAPEHPADKGFQPSLFIEEPGGPARIQLRDVTPRSIAATAPVPEAIAEIPTPLRRTAGDTLLAALAANRQTRVTIARAASHAATLAASSAGGSSNAPAWRTAPANAEVSAPSTERRRQRGGSFSRGLVREGAPPRPNTAVDVESVPLVDELAAEVRAATAFSLAPAGPIGDTIASENSASVGQGGSLVRVRSGMGGRWKGGGSLSGRRAVSSGQLPPTWLVIIVGLGILLVLVGALVIPGMVRHEASQQYSGLINDAEKRFATSRVEQDPSEQRKGLTDAQALLLEAREADPARPEAPQLLAEVEAAIARMDAIKTPAVIDTLADLSQFGNKPVTPSRLTIGKEQVFILDNASSQVIGVTIATGEKKVVYAEDKDAKRGRPVVSAWIESSETGRDTLLVLDANRSLWAYNGSGLRQIPFAAPAGLNVTDMAVRGRDVFVLDANESVVYRFSPGDGGFALPPTRYLGTPDLAAARRLMVDDEIITTDANGTVHRFYGQMSLVLSEAGIDKKASGAEPPQAIGTTGEIAILDAASDRIIVLRRDGTFDRQYRHKDFQGLIAFATSGGHGYVFTNSGHLRRVAW